MSRCAIVRRLSAVLLPVFLAPVTGCTGGWPLGYLPSILLGEMTFLGQRVPIESALDDRACPTNSSSSWRS